MTHQVQGAATKRILKDMMEDDPHSIYFRDPSIFPYAWSDYGDQMQVGQVIFCTNHPKRSWFAEVRRTAEGFEVK